MGEPRLPPAPPPQSVPVREPSPQRPDWTPNPTPPPKKPGTREERIRDYANGARSEEARPQPVSEPGPQATVTPVPIPAVRIVYRRVENEVAKKSFAALTLRMKRRANQMMQQVELALNEGNELGRMGNVKPIHDASHRAVGWEAVSRAKGSKLRVFFNIEGAGESRVIQIRGYFYGNANQQNRAIKNIFG